MKTKKTWRRNVNQLAPLVTTIAGVVIILYVVILMERGVAAVAVAGAGILVLEVGIWYAANPVFTNERRCSALRSELDRFIGCVRELNRTPGTADSEDRFQGIKAAMHESVEAMVGMTHAQAGGKPASEPTTASEVGVQETVGSTAD